MDKDSIPLIDATCEIKKDSIIIDKSTTNLDGIAILNNKKHDSLIINPLFNVFETIRFKTTKLKTDYTFKIYTNSQKFNDLNNHYIYFTNVEFKYRRNRLKNTYYKKNSLFKNYYK